MFRRLFFTLHTVRALQPELRVLFVATLVFRSGTMAFPFLAVYLLTRHEYDASQVGFMVAAYGLGALTADVATGPLLRLISSRSIMVAGLLGNAAVLAVLPLAHTIAFLTATIFLWGFCYEAFTPAAYAETISHTGEEDRKVAFSCYRLAINIGMGIGPAVGAVVFVWSPVALFLINGMLALAAGLYVAQALPASRASDNRVARGRLGGLAASTLRGEIRFWTIFVLALPIHFAYALPSTFLSAYVIHSRGLASPWVGGIFIVNAASVVLFEVPLNTLMRNVSHFHSLLIGYLLAALGFGLMGLAATGFALIGATLVWTAAEMIVFPSLLHYVSDVSEPSVTGRNMGLYSAGANIGIIAAPQLSLALTASGQPSGSWYAAGTAVGLALLLIVIVHRNSYLWKGQTAAEPVHAKGTA
jgi:predicted MFS family arabinose efflux permease